MEMCGHCHNVLSKTLERCTVCGTTRVDPQAADVRRRDDGDLPSHAPGWAAPVVPETGIHPDEFLRELTGGDVVAGEQDPVAPLSAAFEPSQATAPALPPRNIPAVPVPGALAGYLGINVNRGGDRDAATNAQAAPPPPETDAPVDAPAAPPTQGPHFTQHLSTATNVAPDGVAARTTRLDGTVKLGPTSTHRLLTIGAPVLAGLLLAAGVIGSYNIRMSQAQEIETAEAGPSLDTSAVAQTSTAVVRLDLDGCGIIDQATGFLFADQTILIPRSSVLTDNRPTVVPVDGTSYPAEIVGWSSTRNLAVVRTDERLPGGLRWGVSARVNGGDVVSVLAVSSAGTAMPVAATIAKANSIDGRNTSFELDVKVAEGSVVLNAEGFVIGVVGAQGLAQVSDDVAPALSRVILSNDRPQAECPAPPTTLPPEREPVSEDDAEDTTPDE